MFWIIATLVCLFLTLIGLAGWAICTVAGKADEDAGLK